MRKRGFSVSRGTSDFLHGDRDSNQSHLLDLDQRVGDIRAGGEYGTAMSTGRIDGVGSGGLDALDMASRPGDRNPGGGGIDFCELLTCREGSGQNVWMNFDHTSQARVECEMQLAGYDLFDLNIAGMPHLPRCQFECPLLRSVIR